MGGGGGGDQFIFNTKYEQEALFVLLVRNVCHNDTHLLMKDKASKSIRKKEENVLFNNILNTNLIWFYGVGYMVKDHSYSNRKNLLLPLHGLFFVFSSKGSFKCSNPQIR